MNPLRRVLTSTGWLPMLLAALVAGCGGGGLDPILGTPGAGAVPTVTATTPVASTPPLTGVATSIRVSAAFSKDMDPATLTPSGFLLACPAGTPVSAGVAYDAATRVATLTPTAALPPDTLCVATITTAVRDTMGFALAANFVWSFVTEPRADVTRPTVVLTVPAAGARDVANNTAIAVTFSEDMNPASISATTFTLFNTALGTPVAGSVTYSANGQTALFTPSTPAVLPANTAFRATVTTGARDLANNSLAADFVWTFTTAMAPDTTRPTVVLAVPAPNAQGVSINTAITATFSEDMNPLTLSGTSFTLLNNTLGTAVPGTVSYSAISRTAIFTPSTPATLAANSQFTAAITNAAADVAGNTLAANFAWVFTTAAAVDSTRPTVVGTVPAPGAVAVPSTTAITATFSEDMNPVSISVSSFTLVDNTLGTALPGMVTYSPTSRTAVFTPTAPAILATNTSYTGTITTGATDLAGNALAANFAWTFATTVAVSDTTRPTVVTLSPTPDATGVSNHASVTVTFSEDMDPASFTASTFTLTNTTLGVTVPGTVRYTAGSRIVVFIPASLLASNSAFTAALSSSATDLAGNALAGGAAWNFSTAAATGGDASAPAVSAVNPQDGGTGICLTQPVLATFSEPMTAATIGASTFTVTDNGVAVAGSVSYDQATSVASFVPSGAGFAASRNLVATVKGGSAGVRDLAGNFLGADRVWGFTTGTQACGGGGGGGPVNINVNLGTAASFGALGGSAGVTNQGTNTVVGGNLGTTAVCTAITGLHDALNVYTETPLNVGAVSGSINCAPPLPGTAATLLIATQALADATTAYNALAALPPGSDPGAGQLGGRTFTPGVYTAAGGTFAITSGNLTLNAQGDGNAVWVFQSAAALTVGQPALPRHVMLINGAQARNVYWQVGSAARIEDGSTMVGTILAPAGVTISTAGQTVQTTLIGRAIGLNASVTMVNTTIVAP
jgi:hypothetical protein